MPGGGSHCTSANVRRAALRRPSRASRPRRPESLDSPTPDPLLAPDEAMSSAPAPQPAPATPPSPRPRRRRRWMLVPLLLLLLLVVGVVWAYVRGTSGETVARNPSSVNDP